MDVDSLKGLWPTFFSLKLYVFVHNLILILILERASERYRNSFFKLMNWFSKKIFSPAGFEPATS